MILLSFLKSFHWSDHNSAVDVNQGEVREVSQVIAYYLIKLKVAGRS